MPQRILIVPDKFKGTLTARRAARAIARGWHRGRPADRLEIVPMSDGGDGFGSILSSNLQASLHLARSVDAAGRPCRVPWWLNARSRVAVVESARVIGLAMLPPGRYHPFELDTLGLGRLLRSVARRGCAKCLVGIGGSATNDGGFGLARALGWMFLDRRGQSIGNWPELTGLQRVIPPPSPLDMEIIVATDVLNPLLGSRGASRIYGPQKGLRPTDQPVAEAALRRLAAVIHDHTGIDHACRPGAGAAGGLGFGLMAFLGARPEAGFDLFARHAGLDQHLDRASLVITGEGAVDLSSLMGKGVGEISRRCRTRRLPCIAVGGITRDLTRLRAHFHHIGALTDLTTPAEAISRPAYWLARLTRHLAQTMANDD